MIDAMFRPLSKPIPRPEKGYKTCPFKASFKSTLDTLERELNHLKATDIVIEADFRREEIRNDGWPKSTATARTPGIRLSFESRHGSMTYTCATYTGWEENLRGIALTLERLRAIERYGCVAGSEQYRGWTALPPGTGAGPIAVGEWPNARQAWEYLAAVSGVVNTTGMSIDDLYRAAAKKAHPDVGGSAEAMAKVSRARDFFVENHK